MPILRVGVHCSARDAPVTAHDMGTVQIFIVVPQKLQWVTTDDIALKSLAQRVNIWIHSSYLVSPWGARAYNHEYCIQQLRKQVALGARGVIFHLPKASSDVIARGLLRLVRAAPRGGRIILENRAVRPDPETSYETPDKINRLVRHMVNVGIALRDIHFAIDTAHLYCGGVALRTRRDAQRWLSAIEHPECIRLFHLNGNSSTGAADRHAVPFTAADRIWHGVPYLNSGVRAIIDFARYRGIDVIIECNYMRDKTAADRLIKLLQ